MDEENIRGRKKMKRRKTSEDHHRFGGRDDFLLKRSYSFGFERNFPSSERQAMAMMGSSSTVSPWRYRKGSFWSKRPSPFGSLMTKPRMYSVRYYRGMKSPFLRRRGGGGGGAGGLLFPLSESGARFVGGGGGGGGGSSRRSKSMTSPMFARAGGPSPSRRAG